MRLETLLEDVQRPPQGSIVVIPFANQESLDWLGKGYIPLAYAERPRTSAIFQRDCFNNPPKFQGSHVVCYPPWTKRNDAEDKAVFDKYGVDTLYKCFIKILMRDTPLSGTIVLPLRFLTGSRNSEQKRRREFFMTFEAQKLIIFKDQVIDGEIPIVLQFQKRTQPNKAVEPWKTIIKTDVPSEQLWHIDIYSLTEKFIKEARPFPPPNKTAKQKVTVYVNTFEEKQTFYLNKSDPIGLTTIPTENAIKIGVKGFMSRRLKERITTDFNILLQEWLQKTHSLFLPFIMINGKKVSTIDVQMVLEWIEQIIWSYKNSTSN